jgi:hypothetical protein
MQFLRVAALLTLAFASAASSEDQKSPSLPADVRALVEMAAAAPPEFAADALLRLAGSGRVKERELNRQLVEAAFGYAGRAQNPVQLVAAGGGSTDTRAAYRASALRLGLDAATLEARAIDMMIGLDKKTAREMYERLQPPPLEALTCVSSMVPNVAA